MTLELLAGLGSAATPLILDVLASNWMMVLGIVAVLVLALFAWAEYEEDKDAAQLGADVGNRSRRAIGGAAGLTSGLVAGLLGGMYEAGMNFADLGAAVGDIFVQAPETIGGLLVAILGWANMTGIVRLSPLWFVGVALLIIGVGGIVGMRRGTA